MFFPTKSGRMGNSRCPLSISTANLTVAGRPVATIASIAARAVRPVKMTSSISTTCLPVVSNGISVELTTGSGVTLDISSLYMVISSLPKGTSIPSTAFIFSAIILASGTPRRQTPTRQSPSQPRFFSIISYEIRLSALKTAFWSIITDLTLNTLKLSLHPFLLKDCSDKTHRASKGSVSPIYAPEKFKMQNPISADSAGISGEKTYLF